MLSFILIIVTLITLHENGADVALVWAVLTVGAVISETIHENNKKV
ncbi:hypothetical protein G3M81_12430 [Bacillus paralicheniformis]|nr:MULTISPECIES: hypothetical protein [Bacillus]MCY8609909.1 hypothetical protein [Bacillus haynesii]MEC0752144.1 hypothetical protein [Bacillus haynesii]QII49496.1 hypothetical protein G3M81_12430 [Bacillus paralicheniformis]